MKKILWAFLFFAVFGCSKEQNVNFCEGVSPEGRGINCGKKFETGDLTVVFKSAKPFGVNKIFLQIFEENKGRFEKTETLEIGVKPEDSRANAAISFYRAGRYKVAAMAKDEAIGEGLIEVVDY